MKWDFGKSHNRHWWKMSITQTSTKRSTVKDPEYHQKGLGMPRVDVGRYQARKETLWRKWGDFMKLLKAVWQARWFIHANCRTHGRVYFANTQPLSCPSSFLPYYCGDWTYRDRDDENDDVDNISSYQLLSVYYVQGIILVTIYALSQSIWQLYETGGH